MTQFVVIPRGDGYISHSNVDVDNMSLPDGAEIYDNEEEYKNRVRELQK